MPKQKIRLIDNGSRAMRVLDALTPLTGTAAPTVNADYIGQQFIDTQTPAVYVSVAVGSETPADDWKQIAFEAVTP